MSDAREHAITASELLENLERATRDFREVSPEKHLEMAVTGKIKALNETFDFTVQVAVAHALAAIALELTADES